MKAALRIQPKVVECKDLPVPEIKSDEVLIKVDSTGICGSDINRIMEDIEKWNKVVLGHEFAGIVSKVGANVKIVRTGDRVSAAPLVPCHTCEECQKGLFSLCKNYTFIGSRLNGAFAEYVAVPARNIVALPDDLTLEKAALLEPITVCLHPIMRLDNLLGKDVVVTGAGAIGLLAMQIFKAMGARNVVITDVIEAKLELAKKLGADFAVNVAKENLKDFVEKNLPGKGADVVFESSGSNPGKKAAIEAAKGRGIIIQVGTSLQDTTYDPTLFELILRKELTITGSWMNYSAPYPGMEWKTAAWLLSSGKIKTEGIISHRYPIEDIGKAYDMIFGKKEDFVKVIIKP